MKRWMIAVWVVAAACNRGEEHAAAPAEAESEGESTGDADDALEFEDAEEDEPAAEVSTPEDAAKAKVDEGVAASRLALEAERLQLDTRKAEVDAAAAELELRLSGIAELERMLDERIGAGETARQRKSQRIGVLAKLILSMPPQSAAAMVEKMSDEDAQALLLQMSQENERKASKLLSAMPGERAAQLGQLYLDRDPKTLSAAKVAKADEAEAAEAPAAAPVPAAKPERKAEPEAEPEHEDEDDPLADPEGDEP